MPYFSLVLFKGIVRKQHTKKYTLKKCTLGCTDGAISGCTKVESLRTRWYVLSKTKCKIIIEVFHFDCSCFVLRFLTRTSFKTDGEPLNLLTVHPKLIFLSVLKIVFMVPEDRSHQIQYFAKTFPSLLTLTLQTHFYLHFQETAENALWTVIAVKSETFTASESAPATYLETTHFMLFLQNLTKTLKKKLVLVIKFVLMG